MRNRIYLAFNFLGVILIINCAQAPIKKANPQALSSEDMKSTPISTSASTAKNKSGESSIDKPKSDCIDTIRITGPMTLTELLRSNSELSEKNIRDGEKEKAIARWKETVNNKMAISFYVDEAGWGLVLNEALEGKLPDSTKKKLELLNRSYSRGDKYEEIGKQVRVLLDQIPDIKIQRELKKLANRAWEKDKHTGKESSTTIIQTEPPDLPSAPPSTPTKTPANPPEDLGANSPVNPSTAKAPVDADAVLLNAQVDTLAAQGNFMAALKVIEKSEDKAWAKTKKEQVGDRFCEEKRKAAANSFKDYKKAVVDSLKRNHLKKTAANLDSCLGYFPDLLVAQKVRKNREMVELEMKKLK